MKKIILLFFFATSLVANAIWYDFEAGGLYYSINSGSSEQLTVTVTYQSQSSKDNYIYKKGKVIIPEKVSYSGEEYTVVAIGEKAFHHCTGMTSVTIPNTVTLISWQAFLGCTSLTAIDFGSSVLEIRNGAFAECSSLQGIAIPRSVTKLEYNIVYGCKQLETISVDSENPVYDSRNDCNAIIETATDRLISGCLTTKIPATVASIGTRAFSGSAITHIEIPNSVLNIENYAFYECDKLAEVTFGSTLQMIGDYAFYRCYELANVSFPKNLAHIGDGSFYECIGLRALDIPDATFHIGAAAFYGCYRLTDIKLGEKVATIGAGAFNGCSRLTSITIPKSVSTIGKDAFAGCTSLNHVNWNARACGDFYAGYSNNAPFAGLNGITSIDFGDEVHKIPDYLCYELKGLSKVTFGKAINTIGDRAFYGCYYLTSVILPDNVKQLGEYTFYNCSRLKEVELGKSLGVIRSYVFYGCSKLESIVIPHSTKTIGYYAFAGCSNLRSATIGKGIQGIQSHAFSGCQLLTTINSYPDAADIVVMGEKVFEDVPQNVCELHVLPQYLASYQTAPQWLNFLNKIGDLVDDTEGVEQVRLDQLDSGSPMEIYDLKGVKQDCAIDALPAGVYLVRQGNKIAKIAR